MCTNEFMALSVKHRLRTTDCGLGIKYGPIKYGLVKCMVNKGTSSSSSKGLPKITGGNGCEFEHYLFKITAEIKVRKHKLMFCVLLRRGVVSALYRICSFIAMKCVYIVFYCQ